MFSYINDPFIRALVHAIIGGLLGLVFGFIFGAIIVGIGFLIGAETSMDASSFADMAPPLMIAMGFGSMTGAFLGGLLGARS